MLEPSPGDASTHPSDTHLVVSFAGETRILAIDDDDELAECGVSRLLRERTDALRV